VKPRLRKVIHQGGALTATVPGIVEDQRAPAAAADEHRPPSAPNLGCRARANTRFPLDVPQFASMWTPGD